MKINAIYFKDQGCWHIKITEMSFSDTGQLFRINGQNVEFKAKLLDSSNSYMAEHDVILTDNEQLKIETGHLTSYISHYINRETQEPMSVFTYEETLKGFKNANGEYKDLDNEYLFRKMKATYIPVNNTHYTYQECSVTKEIAEYRVDAYTVCAGMLNKRGDFFLYEFNLRQFAEDTVRKIAREFDIEEVAPDQRTCQTKDQFKIYPRTETYRFLEMFGQEYFLKMEDLFFYDRNRFLGYVYGSLVEVKNGKQRIENKIRTKIEQEVDSRRTVAVRKSKLQAIKTTLEHVLLTRSLTKDEMRDWIQKILEDNKYIWK